MDHAEQPAGLVGGEGASSEAAVSPGDRERAGSQVLSIFSRVLNARVLRSHAEEGALSSTDLEQRLGWAPKASLRLATNNMRELGALATAGQEPSRGSVTELTRAGEDLLAVADSVERWLRHSPFGPLPLWDTAARGSIRALTAGWNAGIVRCLAEDSMSLAELSENAPGRGHSYPTLKRRLAKLRSTGLVEPSERRGRARAFGATDWLRGATGPLSVAGRWEGRHLNGGAAPVADSDIEAIFLLGAPLAWLPDEGSGSCVLAAVTSSGGVPEKPHMAAVTVSVEQGRVFACEAGAEPKPSGWALGTPSAWFDAIAARRLDDLRVRGSRPLLVRDVIKGIHDSLFK